MAELDDGHVDAIERSRDTKGSQQISFTSEERSIQKRDTQSPCASVIIFCSSSMTNLTAANESTGILESGLPETYQESIASCLRYRSIISQILLAAVVYAQTKTTRRRGMTYPTRIYMHRTSLRSLINSRFHLLGSHATNDPVSLRDVLISMVGSFMAA